MIKKIAEFASAITSIVVLGLTLLCLYVLFGMFGPRVMPQRIVQTSGKLAPLDLSDLGAPELEAYGPVIRLETMNGRFYCSGYVVNNKYAITAAHCLTTSYGKLKTNKILIYDSNMNDTQTVATPAAVNIESDVGLISGNFSVFKKLRTLANDPAIIGFKGPFVTCGYPYGGVLTCVPFVPEANDLFWVQGAGFIYPGMSGGPVIDTATMIVVGVNSRVSNNSVIIAPLIGFFASIGLQVE